jgi:hypothetical protein
VSRAPDRADAESSVTSFAANIATSANADA